MTRNRIALIAVTVVVAIAATIILATGSDHTDDAGTGTAGTTTPPSAATGELGAPGFFDPVTDVRGRKVYVPRSPAGVVQPQRDPGPRVECETGAAATSPEGVQIQRSYNTPIVVSATDGPSRVEGTVLRGYRRTPQGAAVAGWNFLARLDARGPAMVDTLLGSAVLTDAERVELSSAALSPISESGARYLRVLPAADAFRVLTCDEDFVAVEFATYRDVEAGGRPTNDHWVGRRLNLLWRDGDWKAQLVRDQSGNGSGKTYSSLDGWTAWAL